MTEPHPLDLAPVLRHQAVASALAIAVCALAAKVDAPSIPGGDATALDVQDWILDVVRRVGVRMGPAEEFETVYITAMMNLNALSKRVGGPSLAPGFDMETGQRWIVEVMAATSRRLKAVEP